jgi:hypothetical protein
VAQKEPRNESAEKSPLLDLSATDFAATTKKQIKAFTSAQSEALDNLQEVSHKWLDRIQAETSLASELASKLATARSMPDAMGAYQEWGSRRFEMMAEDTKHLWDDTQKFVQASARLLQSQTGGLSG